MWGRGHLEGGMICFGRARAPPPPQATFGDATDWYTVLVACYKHINPLPGIFKYVGTKIERYQNVIFKVNIKVLD